MGTPEFSVGPLNALVEAGHEIACVYTQPPRKAGRGKAERKTAVHLRAEELNLKVRTPTNFKNDEDIAAFAAENAEIAVVVAYGLLLPEPILSAPKRGCVNIHASLLPRWRGAAPIQRAIMAGDAKTGVCIMQMDVGLDTGPVWLRKEVAIKNTDTAATLHDKLAEVGSAAIVEAISSLDNLTAVPQEAGGVTYAAKIDKSEARINWQDRAVEIDRKIRGLSPFPGAWTTYNDERLKFLLSEVVAGKGDNSVALDDELTIGATDGAVRILRLQRAGKSASERDEFLRGLPVPAGSHFV